MSTVTTYDLLGAHLTRQDVLALIDKHSIPPQGARVRGNLKTLAQIAAIAVRYSIQPDKDMRDDQLCIDGLDGATIFHVKNFKLDTWEPAQRSKTIQKRKGRNDMSKGKAKGANTIAAEADLKAGMKPIDVANKHGISYVYACKLKRSLGLTKKREKAEKTEKKVSRFDSHTRPTPKPKLDPSADFTAYTEPVADFTLDYLRERATAAPKPSWRNRFAGFLRSFANHLEAPGA